MEKIENKLDQMIFLLYEIHKVSVHDAIQNKETKNNYWKEFDERFREIKANSTV